MTHTLIQIIVENICKYAEVGYFFAAERNGLQHTLALVRLYDDPDPDLLQLSYNTLKLCSFLGDNGLAVIDAKWIETVIGMIPFTRRKGRTLPSEEYFVLEKMTLGSQGSASLDGDEGDEKQEGKSHGKKKKS